MWLIRASIYHYRLSSSSKRPSPTQPPLTLYTTYYVKTSTHTIAVSFSLFLLSLVGLEWSLKWVYSALLFTKDIIRRPLPYSTPDCERVAEHHRHHCSAIDPTTRAPRSSRTARTSLSPVSSGLGPWQRTNPKAIAMERVLAIRSAKSGREARA